VIGKTSNGPAPTQVLLPLSADMDPAEAIKRLQVNALASHQNSMGTGDQLVRLLQRTIEQVERTHSRIQLLNTMLFAAGLVVLGVALYGTLSGDGKLWSAILGTAGALAAFGAVFWTTPLDKVSSSVTDLVRLETAFLGYIRVIGEIDSFFQMQYLDILGGAHNGNSKETLANAIDDTATKMKEMMTHAIGLINGPASDKAVAELQKQLHACEQRLGALEAP
jgi:hypothetical protein